MKGKVSQVLTCGRRHQHIWKVERKTAQHIIKRCTKCKGRLYTCRRN